MITNLGGPVRNKIFLILVVVTVIITVAWWDLAGKREEFYIADYKKYVQATQLINQNRFAEAEPVLLNLSESYKDSYLIMWMYGLCLSENNKSAQGAFYMQRARDIRPALLMNSHYLVQYGEILYRLGENKRAERYLEESKKYSQDAELVKKRDTLLEKLKNRGS